MNPKTVRLAPLPRDQWDDEVYAALTVLISPERAATPGGAGNVLATLAHYPALAKAFLHFNAHLLYGSSLPGREREVAILRIAHLCRCPYVWSHHLPLGVREGLTERDFDEIAGACPSAEIDRAIVTAVDELEQHSEISAETWAALGEHLDERQKLDLLFTVGGYRILATVVNTLGIEDEEA